MYSIGKEACRSFYSCVYIAICTSCCKKHAERLVAKDKSKEDQAAATPPIDFERFVGQVYFFYLRFSLACKHNWFFDYCFTCEIMKHEPDTFTD